MGIFGLTKLIADHAPSAIKEEDIKNYFGRLIAIDTSTSLYQFMSAMRTDESGRYGLQSAGGEITSHLQGLFYRSIRMVSNGLKPVFVFDGKPPELKAEELARRKEKKKKAEEEIEKAEEEGGGDKETLKKLNQQAVRVTPEMNMEAKKLLGLMGLPVIEAPCEAEAQCAILCRGNKVFASGAEDMDTLVCGSPILLRNLTYAEARKSPILEIHLNKVLEGLGISMDQFIDLCILLGCDYSPKIKGIGPKKAYDFIKKYGCIEKILKNIDKQKFIVPDPFPYEQIRSYFKNPDSRPVEECDISFKDPDEEGIVKFLCEEKGFSEERVRAGVAKLKAAKQTATQSRITNYFQPLNNNNNNADSPVKKQTPKKKASNNSKTKTNNASKDNKKRKIESTSDKSPQKKAKK